MNTPQIPSVVQGLYYYFTFSSLVALFCLAVYWQTQPEQAVFEVTSKQVVLTKDKKDFVAEINFCSPSKKELKISRYYQNNETSLVYYVPEGTYQTTGAGCFKTILNAYAGRLDPGNYTYHVIVAYELNPLRRIEKEVSTVDLVIK